MSEPGVLGFGIDVRRVSPRLVLVELLGELDVACVHKLEAMLDVALRELASGVERESGGTVALDLRRLRFVDVAGIRSMLECQRRVEAAGAKMVLVRGPAHVQRVLALTQLERAFAVVRRPADVR